MSGHFTANLQNCNPRGQRINLIKCFSKISFVFLGFRVLSETFSAVYGNCILRFRMNVFDFFNMFFPTRRIWEKLCTYWGNDFLFVTCYDGKKSLAIFPELITAVRKVFAPTQSLSNILGRNQKETVRLPCFKETLFFFQIWTFGQMSLKENKGLLQKAEQ